MAFRKKCNTLSNQRNCALKHIQHWYFKQALTREIYLHNSFKNKCERAIKMPIISKVRNWPYVNIALVKYSDSIYKISVILR